jgi:predicted phosphohydrolase
MANTRTIWAIADLHLPGAGPAPDLAATRWDDGPARLEAGWRALVGPDDVVLLPGDVSLARRHRDVQPDLAWLERLPGLKVLAPGNHDRWWNRLDAVRPLLRRSQRAVDGDALDLGGLVVCGARGAAVPGADAPPGPRDAYARELDAIARALDAAAALRTSGQPLYVLWHFPPFDAHGRPGPAVALWEAAGATAVVYGHAHREGQWSSLVQGPRGGVRYGFVAANAVGFHPLKVGTLPG